MPRSKKIGWKKYSGIVAPTSFWLRGQSPPSPHEVGGYAKNAASRIVADQHVFIGDRQTAR